MQGDPRPGRADRMPDRDGAAIDVDPVGADAEITHGLDGNCGERLVDLDQVQVRDSAPGLAKRAGDGAGRLGLQRVVRARDGAVRADPGEDRQAMRRGDLGGGDHNRAGAVRYLGRRSSRDRAVLAEGRPQPAE